MITTFVQFNRFEIELPIQALEACHHQGACDQDVKDWLENDIVRDELNKIDKDALAEELSEYTDWDTTDHEANLERILWIAAGDYQESLEYAD